MRYLLEVAYLGTRYAGFQVQENANTIQAELEKALSIFYKTPINLTGSSRTDAGVHALQNFFHTDVEIEMLAPHVYNINSIMPADVVLKSVHLVPSDFHSRFDATTRQYKYFIYNFKNPFLKDTAWYFPYPLEIERLQEAAGIIQSQTNFIAFSKRNTQVKTHNCTIIESKWNYEGDCLVYTVRANRFLRGMVRALVATMLKVGRGRTTMEELEQCFKSQVSAVDFSAPAHGLFLVAVNYPEHLLK